MLSCSVDSCCPVVGYVVFQTHQALVLVSWVYVTDLLITLVAKSQISSLLHHLVVKSQILINQPLCQYNKAHSSNDSVCYLLSTKYLIVIQLVTLYI